MLKFRPLGSGSAVVLTLLLVVMTPSVRGQEGVIDCDTQKVVNRSSDVTLVTTELLHEVDCVRTGDFIQGEFITNNNYYILVSCEYGKRLADILCYLKR